MVRPTPPHPHRDAYTCCLVCLSALLCCCMSQQQHLWPTKSRVPSEEVVGCCAFCKRLWRGIKSAAEAPIVKVQEHRASWELDLEPRGADRDGLFAEATPTPIESVLSSEESDRSDPGEDRSSTHDGNGIPPPNRRGNGYSTLGNGDSRPEEGKWSHCIDRMLRFGCVLDVPARAIFPLILLGITVAYYIAADNQMKNWDASLL